jgi:glycosyltransferase involved in cell wall biosynthesis
MSKKLAIEGWREINHSYAMVNQYQMLALGKLGINFCHHDLPFFRADWGPQNNFCGFSEPAIAYLNAISACEDKQTIDATYRISYPYRLYPSKGEPLFVFGTSEFQTITYEMVFDDGLKVRNSDRPLKIITPSNWSKVGFLNAGFRDEQVLVVPHGVDLSIFRPLDSSSRAQYRSALGANQDSFIILSVGAMTENKGIDILLAAYLRLKDKYPQIKLVLKDQSNLYGYSANDLINQYCNNNGINLASRELANAVSGFFVISENLNLHQLNGLYGAADCYVSPYRAEGFNLTPLEAAATGTPIIVTDGGSTDDYAHESFALKIESSKRHTDGRSSLEPKLESLIDQLTTLIEKKDTSLSAQKAIDFIEEKFTWDVVTRKLTQELALQ